MGAPKAEQLAYRGVYGVFNGSILMYVGSTSARLENLERNHREWREKGYSFTMFRQALVERGQDWKFVWLKQPTLCVALDIETVEGNLIRLLEPTYNVDKDPVKSSIKYGRYNI